MQRWQDVPLRDGYDSVYIESEDYNPEHFQMRYIMYHAEKCELTHIIRTKIEIGDELDALKE